MYIGSDDRSDLTDAVNQIITNLDKLSEAWNETRNREKIETLVKILGQKTIEILDAIGDVYLCHEEECWNVCKDGWDFCETHGVKKEGV